MQTIVAIHFFCFFLLNCTTEASWTNASTTHLPSSTPPRPTRNDIWFWKAKVAQTMSKSK
jgi:hypothetical protein